MQIYGTMKPLAEAYESCKKGSGPFRQCVTTQFGTGACGNCHYNSESGRCSFHKTKKQKRAGKYTFFSSFFPTINNF